MSPTAVEIVEARGVLDPLVWAKANVPGAVPTRYARFHRDLVALPDPGEAQARVVFRGAAKTTLVRILVAHCAIHHRVRGVLVVRNTYGDVRQDVKSLRALASQLGYPCLVDAEANMVVINGVPIWLRTPGSSVRGVQWTNPDTGEVVRPELQVVDDLETRESARSKPRTDELGSWLMADVMATAGHQYPARTILLGTPITPSSLVAKAMRREPPFAKWLPPMIVPIVSDDGPAWSYNYDASLADRVTDDAWATEYLLNPLPVGSLLFPPDRTRWVTIESTGLECYVAVDPAGDGADATGIVAVCMTRYGLVVVDEMAYTGHAENMPEAVGMFVRGLQARKHRVVAVNVEAVGGFTFALPRIRQQVAPITVVAEAPHLSKIERALPATLWHRNGHIAINSDLRGRALDVELHSWTRAGDTVTGHDDMPDAFVWAGGLATRGWTMKQPAEPFPS